MPAKLHQLSYGKIASLITLGPVDFFLKKLNPKI